MKKLICILVIGLLLSGCVSQYDRSPTSTSGSVRSDPGGPYEWVQKQADRNCARYGNLKSTNIREVSKGSWLTMSNSFWHYDCEKVLTAEEKAIEKKRAEAKRSAAVKLKKQQEKRLLAELDRTYGKECTGSFFNKKFVKGSQEYNNCLSEKKVELDKKQAEIDKKLAAMTPKERHTYNCSTAFKFRKGTEKHNDCVFKLYTAELDMQKLELEKQVAEAQIKAAATQQARAEAVANAQVAAAKASARASSLASSIELMRMGSSMMKSPAPAPSGMGRVRTTCRNVGGFLNCY